MATLKYTEKVIFYSDYLIPSLWRSGTRLPLTVMLLSLSPTTVQGMQSPAFKSYNGQTTITRREREVKFPIGWVCRDWSLYLPALSITCTKGCLGKAGCLQANLITTAHNYRHKQILHATDLYHASLRTFRPRSQGLPWSPCRQWLHSNPKRSGVTRAFARR